MFVSDRVLPTNEGGQHETLLNATTMRSDEFDTERIQDDTTAISLTSFFVLIQSQQRQTPHALKPNEASGRCILPWSKLAVAVCG